jgi:aminoglycoside phosphotransferase (APT) family kinase protein
VDVHDLTVADVVDRTTTAFRRTDATATVHDLRRLEGGVSSLTYAAVVSGEHGDQPIVVKFAPPGLAPVRNRDVLRQATMLDRLADLDGFPVPRVLARDDGAPPSEPPMFAMELRPGDAYEPMLDVADQPPSAEDVCRRQHGAARALATLHSRSPESLGVDESPIPVEEELERWARLFSTVDPDIAVGHERPYERLAARVPAGAPPVVVHGDYRASNMLFRGPDLEAVIDWEIWSVGDPRVDLVWLLIHTDPAHTFFDPRGPADLEAGRLMPSADELFDTYLRTRRELGATDVDLEPVQRDLDWFRGWANYKVASTVSVIHKRDRKRAVPDSKIATAAARIGEVLAAGHLALDCRTVSH